AEKELAGDQEEEGLAVPPQRGHLVAVRLRRDAVAAEPALTLVGAESGEQLQRLSHAPPRPGGADGPRGPASGCTSCARRRGWCRPRRPGRPSRGPGRAVPSGNARPPTAGPGLAPAARGPRPPRWGCRAGPPTPPAPGRRRPAPGA